MFCALFDVKPAAPAVLVPVPAKKKAKKPKQQHPKAAAAEQTRAVAPFESVRETSPEPAPVEALEYEIVGALEEFDDIPEAEADEYEGDASDIEEENYDATSMSLSDHEEPCGSLASSPGIFFARRIKEPKDPKHRPPGIALTFDDDSWIA